MLELYRTTVTDGHWHVAILSDNMTGMAVGGDHQHVCVIDPLTKQWSIVEEKGHSHAIADKIEYKGDDVPKKDEAKTVEEVCDLYKQCVDLERESKDRATEARDFVNNKQWSEEARRILESQDRACLTINITKNLVDMLKGYQRKNRTDITLAPIESSDSTSANLGTELVKHIMEANRYQREKSAAFDDQTVDGRGFLTVYIDYDKNIKGDIVIERIPAKKITIGPHIKTDMSDAEYLFKEDWFSSDKMKSMYPDKADELDSNFAIIKDEKTKVHRHYGNQYMMGGNDKGGNNDRYGLVDAKKKQIKVLECWRKIFEIAYVAYSKDGLMQRISKTEAKKIGTNYPDIEIIERKVAKMRVTKTAGAVLLDDEYIEDDDFDIDVAYCYKDDDGFYGKIESIKDPQRELNKRRSQTADIMNKCASYGWLFDRETFGGDEAMKRTFLNEISHAGFAVEVEDVNNHRPVNIDGVRVPNELVTMDQMSQQTIYSLFNIPMEPQGVAQPDVSAKAILARQRQGLIANEFLFDNFTEMERNVVRRILKLIPQCYDEERIVRLVGNNDSWGPEIAKLLTQSDWSEYDVQITQTLYSDTVRQANLELWMEARNKGFPVPPEVLFELSDLPNKEKVLALFQQQQQQEGAAKQAKENSEVAKSKPKELQLLEAGVPPELAFGLKKGV